MKPTFRILIVEDDRTSVELVKEALNEDEGLSYSLSTASNGDEALRILRMAPEKPNLVFLDLNLPKKSGLEVLKEIKSDRSLQVIPVVILTNSRSQDDVLKAYGHYCNAYIRKPLGFGKLVVMIKATCAFWFETATLPDVEPLVTLVPPRSTVPPRVRQSGTRFSKP